MKVIRFFLPAAFIFYFISCTPVQKIPQYLENLSDTISEITDTNHELIIQKNDLLSIHIMSLSTRPEESDKIFNQHTFGSAQPPGYLVDNNGNIFHHRLGIIHAEGLTRNQLAEEIKKRLTQPVELLKNPTVDIRLLNFKITVLGEVVRQGVIEIPGERISVFEAIGHAGGITDYGKKNRIKIIREINGQRETGFIDLTSKDIFKSPYYYLFQNDIMIVEATDQKVKDTEQVKNLQKISLLLSLASAVAVISNIFF